MSIFHYRANNLSVRYIVHQVLFSWNMLHNDEIFHNILDFPSYFAQDLENNFLYETPKSLLFSQNK